MNILLLGDEFAPSGKARKTICDSLINELQSGNIPRVTLHDTILWCNVASSTEAEEFSHESRSSTVLLLNFVEVMYNLLFRCWSSLG